MSGQIVINNTGENEYVTVDGYVPLGVNSIPTTSYVDAPQPKLMFYIDNSTSSNGTAAQNIYIFAKGPWIVQQQTDFTLTPTTNQITYTGTDPINIRVIFSVALFASTANRNLWIVCVKNPATDTFGPLAPPNLPTGTIVGSVTKGVGQNLNALITTTSGCFTTSVVTGDILRFYVANVSSGDSTVFRDFRVQLEKIN